jgi:hypothetical protein
VLAGIQLSAPLETQITILITFPTREDLKILDSYKLLATSVHSENYKRILLEEWLRRTPAL